MRTNKLLSGTSPTLFQLRNNLSMCNRMVRLVPCWWVIWTTRNDAIFSKTQPDPLRDVYKIKQLTNLWEHHITAKK